VGVFRYHTRRAEEAQLEKARGNDALARAAEAEGLAVARLDELARDYFRIAARERRAGNHALAADAHERALVAATHARAARANLILCGLQFQTHRPTAQHVGDSTS
jgi:hypothetical protein